MRRRRIKLEDAAKVTLQHRSSIFRQRELARTGSHVGSSGYQTLD